MDMAITKKELQAKLQQELKQCYHCGYVSAESPFKYFNNQKLHQPRFQCCNCHKLFTCGLHGRPHGKTYQKKRNHDLEDLRGLHRQCRHCGVRDNAPFKYYNNSSLAQPRFKCLSCHKQFQMRLMGEAHERYLIHTGSTTKPRRQKRSLATTPSCNTLSTDSTTTNMLCGGMPLVPLDPYTSSGAMPNDDVEFVNLIETTLSQDTNEAHVLDEDVDLVSLIETTLSQDTNEAPVLLDDVGLISNYSTNVNIDNVLEMTENAPPINYAIIDDISRCEQNGPLLCGEDYLWNNSTNANVDDNLEMMENAPPINYSFLDDIIGSDQNRPLLCGEDYSWNNSTNANVDDNLEMMENAPPMDQTIMEDGFQYNQSGPPLCPENNYSRPLSLGVLDDTMELHKTPYLEGCNITNSISGPHVPPAQNFDWSSLGY